MRYLTFEFDDLQAARQVARKLWEHHGVTGELGLYPLGGGKWRLSVNSEKELREGTLEKFSQYRVEAD